MATILKTDQFGRAVFDVTDDLRDMRVVVIGDNLLKAERRGRNILMLQRRAGGHWLINYWWTATDTAPLNAVVGSETLKFSRAEIDPAKCLFDQVRLF